MGLVRAVIGARTHGAAGAEGPPRDQHAVALSFLGSSGGPIGSRSFLAFKNEICLIEQYGAIVD
jgi:hypothetical protein